MTSKSPGFILFIKKHWYIGVFLLLVGGIFLSLYLYYQEFTKKTALTQDLTSASEQKIVLEKRLKKTESDLADLKNENQYKINQTQQEEIKNIKKTYSKAAVTYEDLLDLKAKSKNTAKMDELYASSLKLLSEQNYASAEANLTDLAGQIKTETDKISSSFKIPENVPQSNTPPGSGFAAQRVTIDSQTFMVSIVSADLNSTRVIIDTASESDCSNDCPVIPLASMISRSGAYAGITGAYYCPSDYPSCTGKVNTFDLLIMNKNKVYFNSSNNVYSTNPVVVFKDNWARFIPQGSGWGRDTGVDAVIMNFPLLVRDNTVVYGGGGDGKWISRSTRGFVGATGSNAYIGYVHNATLADAAKVIHAMGIQNAMNLDGGGTVALWANGGYKVGPGRNLTNAILFVRK